MSNRSPAHKTSGWRYVLIVLGLTLLVILFMEYNNRLTILNRLRAQQGRVAAQATQSMQTMSVLLLQMQRATAEAAVLEWAYGDAHMVRPGDNPVVPLGAAEPTPTTLPTAPPPPPTPANPARWRDLFFGP
jgi:hypothetical protein